MIFKSEDKNADLTWQLLCNHCSSSYIFMEINFWLF